MPARIGAAGGAGGAGPSLGPVSACVRRGAAAAPSWSGPVGSCALFPAAALPPLSSMRLRRRRGSDSCGPAPPTRPAPNQLRARATAPPRTCCSGGGGRGDWGPGRQSPSCQWGRSHAGAARPRTPAGSGRVFALATELGAGVFGRTEERSLRWLKSGAPVGEPVAPPILTRPDLNSSGRAQNLDLHQSWWAVSPTSPGQPRSSPQPTPGPFLCGHPDPILAPQSGRQPLAGRARAVIGAQQKQDIQKGPSLLRGHIFKLQTSRQVPGHGRDPLRTGSESVAGLEPPRLWYHSRGLELTPRYRLLRTPRPQAGASDEAVGHTQDKSLQPSEKLWKYPGAVRQRTGRVLSSISPMKKLRSTLPTGLAQASLCLTWTLEPSTETASSRKPSLAHLNNHFLLWAIEQPVYPSITPTL
nr:uncharacterized protein LOC129469684 [Symphalangus syndactylus]